MDNAEGLQSNAEEVDFALRMALKNGSRHVRRAALSLLRKKLLPPGDKEQLLQAAQWWVPVRQR
jgi:hypothetical protein